jgi:hypothetical protein
MTIKPAVIFEPKPGKPPAKTDSRTLNLSDYIDTATAQTIPLKVDWTVKVTEPWGMMENWNLSTCTCAAAGHMIECWTANAGKEKIVYDRAVLKAYIALTGYDPKTGKHDDGVHMLAALKYWRKSGIGSHKILAFTRIDAKNHDMVRTAVFLFGGIYVGSQLPNTIKGADIWDIAPGSLTGDKAVGSFGGHAVTVLAYDDQYLYAVSWGKVKKITWGFWDIYVDEVYAVLSGDQLPSTGFDLPALEADLLKISESKKTVKIGLTAIGNGGKNLN